MKIEEITHYSAQAEEHVRRGFAHARVDEWCDAKNEFENAVEICPDCGQLLFRKKGKSMFVCHNTECGYSREMTEAEKGTQTDKE